METDTLARRKKFLINLLFVSAILAIIYAVLKYLIGLVMPFFIALILAAVARPLSRLLSARTRRVRQKDGTFREVERKLRLSRSVAAVVSVAILFIVLAGLLFLVGLLCFNKVLDLVEQAPLFFRQSLRPALESIGRRTEAFLTGLNDNGIPVLDDSALVAVRSAFSGIISSLGTKITEFSGTVLVKVSSIATKIPSLLLSVIITVIATVFLSIDFDSIRLFLSRNLPSRALNVAREFKKTLVDIIWQFIKSYSLIFLITATEICIGFLLVGQKHAILLAMLIALFDAFPIVGSGMILMPFSVITLITGNIPKGVGLLAVWIVVVVARQIIEPRIVGHRVGLRPIVTLLCMYVGTKLFGGIGLFAVPILTAITVDLNRTGTIHLFRPLPFENAERKKPRGKRDSAKKAGVKDEPSAQTADPESPDNPLEESTEDVTAEKEDKTATRETAPGSDPVSEPPIQ